MRRLETMRRYRSTREAEGYLELGMYQQALTALERTCPPDEFEPRAAYLAGEALRAMARYEEALAMYVRAVDSNSEDLKLYLAIGACHKRLGNIEQAIDAMEDALIVDPGNPLVLYNLACYSSLAKRRRRALSFLSRALKCDRQLRVQMQNERDFDAIREDPQFRSLAMAAVRSMERE